MPVAQSGTGKGQGYGKIMRPLDALAKEARETWERDEQPRILTEIEEQQAIIARIRKDIGKAAEPHEKTSLRKEMRDAKRDLAAAEKAQDSRPVWNAGEVTREELARLDGWANWGSYFSADRRGSRGD